MSRWANFSAHEGACSWNRLVQQICPWSLLPHIGPVWYEGVKLGSRSFVVLHIFSLEIVGADEAALLLERVAGACCESKLPRVYRPLRPRLNGSQKRTFWAPRKEIRLLKSKLIISLKTIKCRAFWGILQSCAGKMDFLWISHETWTCFRVPKICFMFIRMFF